MKSLFGECYKILMYTIFGLMIVLSSYTIILNVHHYKSLNNNVVVSDIDIGYKKFMNNVTSLEDNLSQINTSSDDIYVSLRNVLTVLKKDGLFRMVPNSKIGYRDLYNLNEYFIEELINNGWVSNIRKHDISNDYIDEIDLLINNSNYINSIFINNGLLLYDDNNSHRIVDDYHLILNNYTMYSSIILNISNSLGGNSDKVN